MANLLVDHLRHKMFAVGKYPKVVSTLLYLDGLNVYDVTMVVWQDPVIINSLISTIWFYQ